MAKLHNTSANIDGIEYHLDAIWTNTMDRLSTCDYIKNHVNICVVGASGTGKSYISGFSLSSLSMRLPDQGCFLPVLDA